MSSHLQYGLNIDKESVTNIFNSDDRGSPAIFPETPSRDALRAEIDGPLCASNDGESSISPVMMETLNDTSDENESMLMLHFEDMTEAINQMYNLASQIRSPISRKIRTDVDLYKDVDGEIKSEYIKMRKRAESQGIEQLMLQSRKLLIDSQIEGMDLVLTHEDQCLIQRLQKANHARRQQFEYWRRSKKRSIRAASKAIETGPSPRIYDERLTKILKNNTPSLVQPSEFTRSLLSSIPALPQDLSLSDRTSTYSGTSRGLTVHGPSGVKVNWPKPPVTGPLRVDFKCPFCFYFCTPRYSEDAAWRYMSHSNMLRQDETEGPGPDRTSSMTLDPMSVPRTSVPNQMCYMIAGKSGHAMSNGRISEGYGGVRSILSMNMLSLLPTKIM